MEEIIYATFTIELRDAEYSYNASRQGSAQMGIQVPRSVLENIDPGNLFAGMLQAGLSQFDSPEENDD